MRFPARHFLQKGPFQNEAPRTFEVIAIGLWDKSEGLIITRNVRTTGMLQEIDLFLAGPL